MRPFAGFLVAFVSIAGAAHAADWKHLVQTGKGTMVTEFEVGGGDEYDEGDPVFIHPSRICVAADHSFFVIDFDGFVVHFGKDGEELGRFGRQGEGPGELMQPSVAAIDRSGRLLVSEMGNRRVSWFTPDGTFVESRPFQDPVEAMTVQPDGRILLLATGERWSPEMHSVTRLGCYAADLGAPAYVDSFQLKKFQTVSMAGGNMSLASAPFYPQMYLCALPDGSFAWTRSDRYEVHIAGPDLTPRGVLRRDIDPPMVTGKDRDEYFASFDSNRPEFVDRLRAVVEFPKTRPFINGLFADGPYLVVVREGPVLDVFQDQVFLGEVKVPDFMTPRAVDGDRYFRPRYSREELPAVAVYSVR